MKFGKFDISNIPISILMSKIIFIKYLLPVLSVSTIENAQKLLKFGTVDISNMSVSILMSKMIFIKNLPPVRPKLVPKLKMRRF